MNTYLPERHEVPVEQTWNLADIYQNEAAFHAEKEATGAMITDFATTYRTKIKSIKSNAELEKLIKDYNQIMVCLTRLNVFASINVETDQKNEAALALSRLLDAKNPEWSSTLSFVDSELTEIDEDVLRNFALDFPVFEELVGGILRRKPHTLSEETERVLSTLRNELSQGNYGTYSTTKFADLTCPDFEIDGKTYTNSLIQYENQYAESKDAAVRHKAFASFSEGLAQHHYTIGSLYQRHVQNDKLMATIRGYDSVFDYLLESQNVTLELYNRQIDTLMNDLAPIMRRFARVLKRELGLTELRYSDLKASLASPSNAAISFADASTLAVESLRILGEDYAAEVKSAFKDRWIDWATNEGKTTGGFCTGVSGVHPYILMSYSGGISEVFTLVHELGHAISDVFSEKVVPQIANDFSLYAVEAPSTCNEMLLAAHLRKTSTNKELLREVTVMQLQNTYYHNFVTHFLEAAFQRDVYLALDRGECLGVSDFDRIFVEKLQQFWGDEIILDKGAELTWMRQPHYYMGLYSYTYSAGLTIATAASKQLAMGDADAIAAWKKAITYGPAMSALDFAKTAGVDISTDAPLRETLSYVSDLVSALE